MQRHVVWGEPAPNGCSVTLLTVGGRSGSMLVVRGGKAVFSAPGMVVHDVEEINLKEYDRRMSRTTTVYNPITLDGEASASGDLFSTHSTYGERESGFSIPNSALGQANLDRANAYSRKIQQQRDERKFVDPTDITRDDPWTQYDEDAPEAEEPSAAPAAAQPAVESVGEGGSHEEEVLEEPEEHTWYGDAREWLSEKLSFDISMPEQDPNFLPWIGSEAFVQLGIDQKIEDGSWLTYTAEEREGYIRSKAEEYRMQLDIAVNMNMLTEIPGALARGAGKFTTWLMDTLGARKAVAKDTGQFVTDVGEWIGFGYAGAILKEFKLVGKVVEGMPLKVFRKNVKITLPNGETKIIKQIYKVEYCQIHHILSDKNDLILNHPLLKKAAFDLNDPVNKMILPTVEGAKRSTTLKTIHQYKHVEKYSEELAIEMNRIHTQGMREGWNQAQYRTKLEALISETRQQLKCGKTHLNKTTRESKGLPLAGE